MTSTKIILISLITISIGCLSWAACSQKPASQKLLYPTDKSILPELLRSYKYTSYKTNYYYISYTKNNDPGKDAGEAQEIHENIDHKYEDPSEDFFDARMHGAFERFVYDGMPGYIQNFGIRKNDRRDFEIIWNDHGIALVLEFYDIPYPEYKPHDMISIISTMVRGKPE